MADFDNPEVALPSATCSPERWTRNRATALVRLLWDSLGTEFGRRHQQYEKFYGGAPSIVKQNVYRNFDFKRATALVDRPLHLPALDSSPSS